MEVKKKEKKISAGRGGEPGMVPSNNDWAPWMSGGELRAARFLAPLLRDSYGYASGAQLPGRSHAERKNTT